jgi:hypothetical protein
MEYGGSQERTTDAMPRWEIGGASSPALT